ncbi:MAG: polymer-forming cytoskeletal protein [Chloroflexi bacterium]|nr:polymer-forming cytoskeletal protein [Chloroflexota bacterium]
MKRVLGILIGILVFAFAATPAMAQSPRGDRFCMGGSTIVGAEENPDNVLLFGCGARIQKGAQVDRDVVSFGGDVVLEESTRVQRDVVIFGGDLKVGGTIDRDITVFGGRVTLDSTAVVKGNVLTFGGGVDKKEGATVSGQVMRNGSGTMPRVGVAPVPPVRWNWFGDLFWGFVQGFFTMVGLAALGALILVFMPNHLKQVSTVAEQSALPSLGVGCLTWLVAPPLMILFIVTCLGIPLSAILGILLVAASAFGWIAIAILLGDRLLNALKVKNIVPILSMVVGLVVLWLISAVPFLGWLIGLLIATLAVGAVVLTRFGTRPFPIPPAPTSTSPVPVTPSPVVPSEPAPQATDDPSASI